MEEQNTDTVTVNASQVEAILIQVKELEDKNKALIETNKALEDMNREMTKEMKDATKVRQRELELTKTNNELNEKIQQQSEAHKQEVGRLQRELEDLKRMRQSSSSLEDVNRGLATTNSDLKEEIKQQAERHEASMASLHEELGELKDYILFNSNPKESNDILAKTNEALVKEINELKLETKTQQESLTMLREELQELRDAKFESDTTSQEEEEDKKTIDELKEKVMVLVEEKLHLQSMVDSLEHQFVEVDLEENNKDMLNKKSGKLGSLFDSSLQRPKPLVFDDDASQVEISHQTIQQQQSKQWGNRIMGVFSSTERGGEKIDIDAFRRTSEEKEAPLEDLTTSRKTWSSFTRLSNGNLTSTMLDSMSGSFDSGDATYQSKFLSRTIEKNQKPPTTWDRLSSYMTGSSKGYLGDSDAVIDVQRLKNLAEASTGANTQGRHHHADVIHTSAEPESRLDTAMEGVKEKNNYPDMFNNNFPDQNSAMMKEGKEQIKEE